MAGALDAVKVLEMGGPPGAFGTALLADFGADVIRVARPAEGASVGATVGLSRGAPMDRGKRGVAIDLNHPDGADAVLALVERADVFVEGFRPGVAERLGIGPASCLARNPRLVYTRMTGWGQQGPWAARAGHDLNYVALSGTLSLIGPKQGPPSIPVNLLGDWAGGLLMAFGVVAALRAAERTGAGQIVDAAMVDASTLLASVIHGALSGGTWVDEREANMTDGGWPYYSIYETADHRYVSVGALEPKFFQTLVAKMGLADAGLVQEDRARWPEMRRRFADTFASKTRDEWVAIMEGADACFAPVLSMIEARAHPHNVARAAFVDYEGIVQPAPAPRLSATPARLRPWAECLVDAKTALKGWGFDGPEIDDLISQGALHSVSS